MLVGYTSKPLATTDRLAYPGLIPPHHPVRLQSVPRNGPEQWLHFGIAGVPHVSHLSSDYTRIAHEGILMTKKHGSTYSVLIQRSHIRMGVAS
ncbi:hypothetical protein CLAFUW4_05908 [Fulvia fulva]|uniref:Uncharacterized protein n=1 Tax=Passalora fulva TaxID=5499 RepID=A0A9Q8P9E0_PASFU|nr:uncharacterized protein CLAFUR5_06052 [Fulvia fulva]KAK4624488.1 hypothetical protein CLAFUR4_05913 [Fulvia fulva]KAK4625743.1 hypothetical protein CLAFUR0_05915 [Fulvia fulva]UJO18195.1 hypothetical protein CLAFUR5_06052 [Fulvia fulva]WPV15080.1 hypothetical protein CLAFUW4_05908 [Fulvia fulva]WPV29517.1 hypothetical protein CLAFUW7_05906 [Fulvia fulva]